MKQSIGWGFGLWFVGYALGIVLFFLIPPALIGWVIMPLGVVLTLWVLVTRVRSSQVSEYVILAFVWTGLAVALDYVFIVKTLSPADGYYKPDVYLYYALTFLLPPAVGWMRSRQTTNRLV